MRATDGHEPPPAWWVRGCRHLWHLLLWMWGVLIAGIGINVGSARLIAPTFSLTKTPLGWLLDHPALSIAFGGSFLALTALVGGVTAAHRSVSPSSSSLTLEQQNRQRFLAKLQSRYSDLFAQSLQGVAPIALTFHSMPTAVQNMTRLRLRQAVPSEQDFPAGTSILEVYDQAGGDLLILGEPGAGKTIQLVDLAMALRERAALDEHHPLPVIVNLSTWANQKLSLEEWLSEEAAATYDVPHAPLLQWVRQDQFLPLLDGLDEVSENARAACIGAINTFRAAHLVQVVVCSRSQEYAALQSRLVLQNAVEVQLLETEQVDAYIKAGDKAMVGIRSLLRKDAGLRELVSTPLMLHVVTLAYHGVSVQALAKQTTLEERRRHIFKRYVQRRLEEPQGEVTRYSLQDTCHWLSWLARHMRKDNQTIFYLEHLQSDWLPEGREQDRYERVATRGTGIIMGVVVSLLVTIVIGGSWLPSLLGPVCAGGLLGGLISGKGSTQFHLLGIRSLFGQRWKKVKLLSVCAGAFLGGLVALEFALQEGLRYPYDWVIFGSSLGLCGCVLTMLVVLGKQATQQTVSSVPGLHWWHRILPRGLPADVLRLGILVGLLFGLSTGLSAGLLDGQGGGLLGWLAGGLDAGLSTGLHTGLNWGVIGVLLSLLLLGKMGTIELAEHLVWSRKEIRRSLLSKRHFGESARLFLLLFLFFGLGFGLGDGLDAGLLDGVSRGLSIGLTAGLSLGLSIGSAYWLLLGLWKGLSRETLDDHVRTKPNQGILRSIRSAFLVGGFAGIICFLVNLLNEFIANSFLFAPHFGPGNKLIYSLSFQPYGLSSSLNDGLIVGCMGFLLAAMLMGGLAGLRHLILRLQLRRLGVVPPHYVRFLDDAARRVLLYKDGGGYRFIHRLFLDYFADLEAEPTHALLAAQRAEIGQGQTNGVTTEPQRS